MNRHARRKSQAIAKDLPPARQDGKPQYYDINEGDRVQCITCLSKGITVRHGHRQAVMSDPSNPPKGAEKGSMHTICVHHLPENAVIFNPVSGKCRNKSGDHTWEE